MAEVLKHYLIADKKSFFLLVKKLFPHQDIQANIREIEWEELIRKNIAIKSKIVAKDKFETSERKALNFAHTIGHAIETYLLNRGIKVLHGEAVAAGIICETLISVNTGLLAGSNFTGISVLVSSLIPNLPSFRKQSIPAILRLIQHDKKNSSSRNRFTLLKGIGEYSTNNEVEEKLIADVLEYYSEVTLAHKLK